MELPRAAPRSCRGDRPDRLLQRASRPRRQRDTPAPSPHPLVTAVTSGGRHAPPENRNPAKPAATRSATPRGQTIPTATRPTETSGLARRYRSNAHRLPLRRPEAIAFPSRRQPCAEPTTRIIDPITGFPAQRGKRDSVVPGRRIDLYKLTPVSRSAHSRSLIRSGEVRVVVRKQVRPSIVKAALLHPPGDAGVRRHAAIACAGRPNQRRRERSSRRSRP